MHSSNPVTEDSTADRVISRTFWSCVLFGIVVAFALMNCAQNNILAHLWVVVAAIVCPLLDMFIPGIFYVHINKEEEEEEEEEAPKSCRKFKGCLAWTYTIFGAILLPLLLTLATKALFSTSSAMST